MLDSTKTEKDDLRFLLKDKYKFSELEIEKIINGQDEALITDEIKADITRLSEGQPLDYIIGHTDFLGLKINLNQKPLIPRPETEFWTQKIINTVNKESKLNILDIFCGSGCIGLALLKSFPNATCTFADINPDFLSQTQQNAEINSIAQNKIQLVQSDLLNNISGKFDLIVANPPYVAKNDTVGDSVKHEPEGAIYAENNGFELIERFLKSVSNSLNDGGRIFMEFGETQKDRVEEILKSNQFNKWEFHKDQFDKWRWVEIS